MRVRRRKLGHRRPRDGPHDGLGPPLRGRSLSLAAGRTRGSRPGTAAAAPTSPSTCRPPSRLRLARSGPSSLVDDVRVPGGLPTAVKVLVSRSAVCGTPVSPSPGIWSNSTWASSAWRTGGHGCWPCRGLGCGGAAVCRGRGTRAGRVRPASLREKLLRSRRPSPVPRRMAHLTVLTCSRRRPRFLPWLRADGAVDSQRRLFCWSDPPAVPQGLRTPAAGAQRLADCRLQLLDEGFRQPADEVGDGRAILLVAQILWAPVYGVQCGPTPHRHRHARARPPVVDRVPWAETNRDLYRTTAPTLALIEILSAAVATSLKLAVVTPLCVFGAFKAVRGAVSRINIVTVLEVVRNVRGSFEGGYIVA